MIYTYKELIAQKEKQGKLNWDDITREQLEALFMDEIIPNNLIAQLYDVTPSKVKVKRAKWDILQYNAKYTKRQYEKKDHLLFQKLNGYAKEELAKVEHIDWFAKALTHYLFRNGPVENMHANGQLSQSDMKTLNKYMVNRIAGLLKTINDGEWAKILAMFEYLKPYGIEWDEAVIDTKDIEIIFHSVMNWPIEEEEKETVEV